MLARGDVIRHHPTGDWFRIRTITGHTLSGTRFKTASSFQGIHCDSTTTEVVQMRTIVESDNFNTEYEIVSVEDFYPISYRASLLFTSTATTTGAQAHAPIDVENHSRRRLICRSKRTEYYKTNPDKREGKIFHLIWENLSASECSRRHGQSGSTIRYEQYLSRQTRSACQLSRQRWPGPPQKTYSGCDAFSGAGFASDAMRTAGIDVNLAFDKDPDVWETYRYNHRKVHLMTMDFAAFINAACPYRIDILNASFPCQFFSPANTANGLASNDEANEAVWLGLGDLLRVQKPRMVVIEQTFGINAEAYKDHLWSSISAFRNHGYSIQIKVLDFASLGMCSRRRRMIFLAAARGETLPPYPQAMYNVDFVRNINIDLADAVTVADVLRQVDRSHVNHNIRAVELSQDKWVAPYDPSIKQIGTITCSGVDLKHYSGRREFTDHEQILLNGGSPTYVIKGSTKKTRRKQIGNAFPPVAGQHIFGAVVEHLRWTDAADRAEAEAVLDREPSVFVHR